MDARIADAVIRVAEKHRVSEPFFLLCRQRPDWTLERWERAVKELEHGQIHAMR